MESARTFMRASRCKGIAEHIRSQRPKVIVLLGAGASTSAGLHDYRSPGLGVFDKLKQVGLPETAAFDLRYFRENPETFYSLARELWPQPDRQATPAHQFVRILHEEGLLLRCYTQNIDALESKAGIPDDLLVEAHGNFRSAHGVDTHRSVSPEEVRAAVFSSGGAERLRSRYGELVKPGVVFYGERLPARFEEMCPGDFPQCQMLIVMGTSLAVAPFRSLVSQVPPTCQRILINQCAVGLHEKVPGGLSLPGGFSFDPKNSGRDVMIQGACDDTVRELCAQLGWAGRLAPPSEQAVVRVT